METVYAETEREMLKSGKNEDNKAVKTRIEIIDGKLFTRDS